MDANPTRRTQAGTCRQSLSFIDSSIFETSDAEKLVKYIRQKRGINYAQRIFDDSPANEVAERSFPIEIQPIQEKAKAVSPLKHSTKEVTTSSNPRIPRVHLKRISSQKECIGKRIFLKNFEKSSGGGESFHPAAFSTPISMVTSEDPNISGISKITRDEEIPETQEPNEIPKTAEDNHKASFDAGMQYSVNPLAIAHQQEETLKDNNQVDEANDSVTLFNNGDGTKQDKAKSWKSCSLRSKQIKSSHCSTLSQQMPLNEDGRSVQQNVLEKPSDSDTCSKSGDDERNLAQNNQNTKNKYTAKMSTSVERNTKQISIKSPNRLNNSSLRMLSNENVKQTVQQAVFEEPSYSNLNRGIKSNDFNMGDKNSDRKTTDQTTSNIEDNSRRSRVKTQNLTASSQVPPTKEIEQTSRHIALRWSSNSDSGSEDSHENPMPEENFKENKNSKNKSAGQNSSNRNLNSRKSKLKSSDCRARSIQAVTLDRYSSNSSSEEDCRNYKENKNPKAIRGRTLSRIDPSSRRSKVKPRNRLLQEVPTSSNKQTETDQQIASERSHSKNDFPKKREIPRKSTEHTSSRIEQNSKNIRVVSMEGRDKPLIYMPIIQNFHKETERENGRCDKEKKCEKASKTVSMTKDVGCQNEIVDLMTSDEDVENMDQVLTPRKHNITTKNKKMFLRQSNNINNPEPNRTDICGVETGALHCSLESSDINTVENFNDKFVAVNSMQKNDIIAMNKVSQTHNRPQIVRKGKKRFSQMDPIKQDYLNIRKKLRNATMQNVNVSRRKLYSKGNSDEETSELSDFSQETPVIPHSKEETRKTLNFSRNPRNEKVSNKSAQRLQSINSCVGDSNNEEEFTDSTSTVDAVNKNDIVFKKPTKPVSKPPKKKIGKKENQKDIAKVNSNNAMQKSNTVISMEEKHQSRIVSRNETLKTNIPKESTYNECNSSDLPVEPDEVNDQPIEPVAISRTSVEEKNNNRKAILSDISENTKSMVRRTDETKDNNAKQSQKNKEEKYSHGSKSKPMKSSHPPSEELNERLRRSSRQRKLPIAYWSCRLQHLELGEEEIKETFSTNDNKKKKMPLEKKNKTKIARSKKELKSDENKENSENLKSKVTQNNVMNKDAADRVTMNESQIACEFDRLKESFSIEKSKKRKDPRTNEENVMNKTIKLSENPSTKVPECNEKPPKAVNQQETARVSSDDGISTSEENHHPKPPWCTNLLRTPTTDSGNQTGTINDTHVNRENRLFSWLKSLSTPRTLTRNKDVVQILHSNTIKIANVEDLMFQEVNGVEYAYYLEEDNNYGYMKFHPHSAKPNARTKNVELKFLSLVGSIQMKIDENLITIKNGDLVTVSKGVRYCISNPSNDPAVLFFIRTINPT